MKMAFCPQCGTKLEEHYLFCPKCGLKLETIKQQVKPESKPLQEMDSKTTSSVARELVRMKEISFQCQDSGQTIAKAQIPVRFYYTGRIQNSGGNSFSQLRDSVKANSEDKRTILYSESHQIWEDVQNPMMKQLVKNPLAAVDPANLCPFQEPEELMTSFAQHFTGINLVPDAVADLPGSFAQNRGKILENMIQTFLSRDGTAPNVDYRIINAVCTPLLIKYYGMQNGRKIVVLVGCEYVGIEYRNAITATMMTGGAFGMLSMLKEMQSRGTEEEDYGSAPFGHGREYGKKTDMVRWGYNRMYLCVSDAARESMAMEQFLRFVVSFRPDDNLTRKREQAEHQLFMQSLNYSNALAQQARQGQIMAQQRAMETSRMIARNSAEISAGIMDSWNRKMASDSRISQNYSEAVRGVNTYQTTSGRSVEVDVTADHVYENRYGDVYGVSGSEPDQDLLSRLNWTELKR